MDEYSVLSARSIDFVVLLQHHPYMWYAIIYHHQSFTYPTYFSLLCASSGHSACAPRLIAYHFTPMTPQRNFNLVLHQHFKCHQRHLCIASPTASPPDIWNLPLSEALANSGYSCRLELRGFSSNLFRRV